MRFNTEKFINNALSTDAGVLALVGSADNVLAQYPNTQETVWPFPLVSFREIDQPDELYADEDPFAVLSIVEVQVFTAYDTSAGALARAVADALNNYDYKCTSSQNLPDPEGGFQRRIMTFQRAFIGEEIT